MSMPLSWHSFVFWVALEWLCMPRLFEARYKGLFLFLKLKKSLCVNQSHPCPILVLCTMPFRPSLGAVRTGISTVGTEAQLL